MARTGPYSNLLAIRNKLLQAFREKITSRVIVGFWKRSLDKAKEYLDLSDSILLVESDDENSEIEEIENKVKKILIDNKHHLSWISFEEFRDFEMIGKGGFATVYCARWIIKENWHTEVLRLNYLINLIIIMKNL